MGVWVGGRRGLGDGMVSNPDLPPRFISRVPSAKKISALSSSEMPDVGSWAASTSLWLTWRPATSASSQTPNI